MAALRKADMVVMMLSKLFSSRNSRSTSHKHATNSLRSVKSAHSRMHRTSQLLTCKRISDAERVQVYLAALLKHVARHTAVDRLIIPRT